MRMKKLIPVFVLSSLLALSAAGCGSSKKAPELPSPEVVEVESETETDEYPVDDSVEEDETTTEAATEEETAAETQTEAAAEETTVKTMAPGEIWYVGSNAVNGQLNVRALPDVNSDMVGQIYLNEEARIEEAPNGEWVRIHSHSCDGYVKFEFLSPEMPGGSSEPAAPTEPQPAAVPAGNGHIVCIDAGHQQSGISETEPNGPGSTVMKAKLTSGATGVATGQLEYQLNLDVALKLQAELTARGYTVVMIRTTNDCPASNAERAQTANNAGAEVFVRVHANSSDNPDVRGAMFYAPSPANPYMSQELVAASNALANTMLNTFCATTGIQNRGLLQDDTMTGINWCRVPVTIAEMGFLSNPDEDRLMADPSFQTTMAQGLANGIDAYFGITR